MTISNDNGILRVVLSEAETIHYGIDDIFFEEDCSNSKTALKNLLKSAARTVGFFADTLQFLIEIQKDQCLKIIFVKHGIASLEASALTSPRVLPESLELLPQ